MAIAAAKKPRSPVVFLWARLEPVFGLPGDQDELVDEVAAVNPNTIVVLNTSQPVALPWVNKVRAILEMWWPGDEGGWSSANLLLGKISPAGRLPVTWGKRLADYPATDPRYPERSYKGVNGKTTYSEGVNVGYPFRRRPVPADTDLANELETLVCALEITCWYARCPTSLPALPVLPRAKQSTTGRASRRHS